MVPPIFPLRYNCPSSLAYRGSGLDRFSDDEQSGMGFWVLIGYNATWFRIERCVGHHKEKEKEVSTVWYWIGAFVAWFIGLV